MKFFTWFRSLCFNPRPSRERGATQMVGRGTRIHPVSIRAPRVSEGRPIDDIKLQWTNVFQSAPLA